MKNKYNKTMLLAQSTRNRVLAWILVIVMTASASSAWNFETQAEEKENTIITEAGVAKAEIVIDSDASEVEQYAAEELQYHVEKVSGAKLTIRTGIGNLSNGKTSIVIATPDSYSQLNTLFPDDIAWLRETGEPGDNTRYGDDGFSIRENAGVVYIFGTTAKGALNGVYDFIEENMGVLWTRADEEIGLVYDEMSTISVSQMNYREKSPFAVRGWHLVGTGTHNGINVANSDAATEVMMSRNKLNAKFAEPMSKNYWSWQSDIGLEPFHLTHNIADLILQSPSYDSAYEEYWNTDENGNHYRPSDANWATTYQSRQVNYWDQGENGKTLQTVIDSVLDFLVKNPAATSVGVGVNDGMSCEQVPEQNSAFEYEVGKTVSPSADNYKSTVCFSFINKVAQAVAKQYPNVTINAYAYSFAWEAPECEIEDNVRIVFAPVNEDATDSINPSQDSNSLNKTDFATLQGWQEKTSNIVTYNYYGCFIPSDSYERPIADKIQGDLQYYAVNGFEGLIPEGVVDAGAGANTWAMNALTFWLYSKLAWNPYENVEELIKEFCDKVYGDASDYMQEYYGYLQQGWNNGKEAINVRWDSQLKVYLKNFVLESKLVDKMLTALAHAYRAANDVEKQRIGYIKQTFESNVSVRNTIPELTLDTVKKYSFESSQPRMRIQIPKVGNIANGIGMTIWVDGQKIPSQGQHFFWEDEASSDTMYFYIYYSVLGGTSASNIGTHTVEIKAGSYLDDLSYVFRDNVVFTIKGGMTSSQRRVTISTTPAGEIPDDNGSSVSGQIALGELIAHEVQDGESDRYKLTFANTDGEGIEDAKVAVWIDGTEVTNKAYFWYLRGNLKLFIPYEAFGAGITKATDVGTHTVQIKAQTTVGDTDCVISKDTYFVVSGEQIIQTNSLVTNVDLQGKVHGNSFADDTNKRYGIYFSVAGISNVARPTLYVDGKEVKTEGTATYAYNAASLLILYLGYEQVQPGATTAAEITEHIVTMKAGTVLDTYLLSGDCSFKVKGNSVTDYEPPKEIALENFYAEVSCAVDEDNPKYSHGKQYRLMFAMDKTIVGESVPTIYVDGKKITPEGNTYFRNREGYVTFYIDYRDVEPGATDADSIGIHTVKIEAGSMIGENFILAEDYYFRINGRVVAECSAPADISFKDAPISAASKAYDVGELAGIPGNQVLVILDLVPVIYGQTTPTIYVDGKEVIPTGNTYFADRGNDYTTLYLDYNDIQPGATAKSQLKEHIITIKAGTSVGVAHVLAEDYSCKVSANAVSQFDGVKEVVLTNLSAASKAYDAGELAGIPGNQILLIFDLDPVIVGKTTPTIYVDGKEVIPSRNTYFEDRGADYATLYLDYNDIQPGAAKASDIGEHVITIKAGTLVGAAHVLAEDYSCKVSGTAVKEYTAPTLLELTNLRTEPSLTGGVDANDPLEPAQQYRLMFQMGKTLVGESVPTIYLDGKKITPTGNTYFKQRGDHVTFYLDYADVEPGKTKGADIGIHTVKIEAGSMMGENYVLAEDYYFRINGSVVAECGAPEEIKLTGIYTNASLAYDTVGGAPGKQILVLFDMGKTMYGKTVPTIYVDGKEVIPSGNTYFEQRDVYITLYLDYNDVQPGATTASQITEHTIMLKAGESIGVTYVLAEDFACKVSGTSGATSRAVVDLGDVTSCVHDATNKRYNIAFTDTTDIEGEAIKGYVDGDTTAKTVGYIWNLGGTLNVLLYYEWAFGETELSEIGNHTVVIKKGTVIGTSNYVLGEDINLCVTPTGVSAVESYDVSQYRNATIYTAPKKDGMIFAGWYEDAAFTKPLSASTTTGTAYAKFVSEAVLSTRAQVTAGTTATSAESNIRFVSTVDSLDYKEVGFIITVEGRATQVKTSTTVYEQLRIVNGEEADSVLPSEFSAESKYFFAYSYWKVPQASFGTKFTVTAYYTTMDGTIVVGNTVVKCVADAYK